jgi:hypothetical protein
MIRSRPHSNSIWPTRRDLSGAYVKAVDGSIELWIPDGFKEDGMRTGYAHLLSRHEARLIAKRLNQCLDATVLR